MAAPVAAAEEKKYSAWLFEAINGKTDLREVHLTRAEWAALFKEQLDKDMPHIFTARWQDAAFKRMQGKLRRGHVLMHMDFAEKFAPSTGKETQSMHWNNRQVSMLIIITLHIVRAAVCICAGV